MTVPILVYAFFFPGSEPFFAAKLALDEHFRFTGQKVFLHKAVPGELNHFLVKQAPSPGFPAVFLSGFFAHIGFHNIEQLGICINPVIKFYNAVSNLKKPGPLVAGQQGVDLVVGKVNDLRQVCNHGIFLAEQHDELRIGDQGFCFVIPQDIVDFLRHPCCNKAVFAAAFPAVAQPVGRAGGFQAVVDFIIPQPRVFVFSLVFGDPVPAEILNDRHGHHRQLLPEIPGVKADQPVVNIYIGFTGKDVQASFGVNFQGARQVLGRGFLLLFQEIVEIHKRRDVFFTGMLFVFLIDSPDAAVDNGLHGQVKPVPVSHGDFDQGNNKIRLKPDGVRLVVASVEFVNIKRVEAGFRGIGNFNNLPSEKPDQFGKLPFGVDNNHIVVRPEKAFPDLQLGGNGFAGTGTPKEKFMRVFKPLAVQENDIVGKFVFPVEKPFRMDDFNDVERDEPGNGRRHHGLPYKRVVPAERDNGIQPVFLGKRKGLYGASVLGDNILYFVNGGVQFGR